VAATVCVLVCLFTTLVRTSPPHCSQSHHIAAGWLRPVLYEQTTAIQLSMPPQSDAAMWCVGGGARVHYVLADVTPSADSLAEVSVFRDMLMHGCVMSAQLLVQIDNCVYGPDFRMEIAVGITELVPEDSVCVKALQAACVYWAPALVATTAKPQHIAGCEPVWVEGQCGCHFTTRRLGAFVVAGCPE
jgi:hypothetical protein